MKKKMRKFADGGYSTVDSENPVPSINDDVRSRAMKFVENASEESRDIGAPVTRSAAKSTSKVSQTVAPPKTSAPAMPAEEKERMESLVKKQALERVVPEEMIGGGAGKLLQMAGKRLSSKIATDRATKQAAEAAVKKQTRRSEEGFDPADAIAAREKVKTDELIKKAQRQTRIPKNISKAEQEARKERYLSTGPMEDAFGTGSQFKRGFKSGGKVSKLDMQKAGFYDKDKTKSERQNIVKKVTTKPQRIAIVEKAFSSKNMKSGGMASRRADGCAIRGKTRA
jgi:hypothetical protein